MVEIPGVGPKTVEKLLRSLGSLERVRQASKEELAQVVGAAAANRLRAYFAADVNRNPLVQIAPAEETESEYAG
jgi:ERCC4-type nuclease